MRVQGLMLDLVASCARRMLIKSKNPPWLRGIRRAVFQMASANLPRKWPSDAVALLVTDHSIEMYSVYDRYGPSTGWLAFRQAGVCSLVLSPSRIGVSSSFGTRLVRLFGSIRRGLGLLDGSVG